MSYKLTSKKMSSIIFLLLCLCFHNVFNLEIIIQNDLINDIKYPKHFLVNGGMESAPISVPSRESSYFKVQQASTTTPSQGIVTLPINGYVAGTVSIAYYYSKSNPNTNKIGIYYGTNQASQILLTDTLNTAVLASSGWNFLDLGTSGIRVSYFMSSTAQAASVYIILRDNKEMKDGTYYIKSSYPGFENMYLKLAPNNYDILLEYYEKNEDSRFRWLISEDSQSSHYRIKSDSNGLTLCSYDNGGKKFYDVRDPNLWTSNWPQTHWRWDIDAVSNGDYVIYNLWADAEININQCKFGSNQAACKNQATTMLLYPTAEIQKYAFWKILLQP